MLLWPDHPAFSTPLSQLKGVGPKTTAQLAEEGFHSTGDLLALSPRFYQDRRQALAIAEAQPEQESLLEVQVVSARARWSPRTRRRYLEALVEDEAGDRLTLCWFNFAAWMAKSLPKGRRLRVFGRVRDSGRRLEMIHPDLDFISEDSLNEPDSASEDGLRPVYPAIGELSSGLVKKMMVQALEPLPDCPPIFPEEWLEEKQLADPTIALSTLHRPPSDFSGPPPRPSHCRAFRQLALFELLFWRLMMLRARSEADRGPARPHLAKGKAALRTYWKSLPFKPSLEQKRVTEELLADLSGTRPMSRLLQGEVGGGKTAVAGAALFFALGCGGQAALMAPTEVLARQHYEFFKKSAEAQGYAIVLLTGSLTEKEKRAAREALASGQARLAVGSQALVSPATEFHDLSLAVIDEQHRFGVRQRLALRRKNQQVDILAMSATPIPRSLTLMLYGDLDSSSLKGLLPGRRPAETRLFQGGDHLEAYRNFLNLVEVSGGQGFVVTPRIEAVEEENGDAPLPSLEEIRRDLADLAGDLKIESLHGQQDTVHKEKVMEEFRQGRTRVLVATSIIEVGVDVPAARVILIIGAERFGLAQLHQLRGRVGRGGEDGYCLLLPWKLNANGERRLTTLVQEHNGQALAELDLEMRGPGEQLGLRQSGWPAMTYARLPQDLPLLAKAHELAEELMAGNDPAGGYSIWERLNFSALEERLSNELLD